MATETPLTLTSVSAVIFDFNGTLSDDEGLLRDIFIQMASEHGVRLDAARYGWEFAGRSDEHICTTIAAEANLGPQGADTLLTELATRYAQAVQRQETIHPATRELVRALVERGVPLALVTGAAAEGVRAALARVGLQDAFPVLVADEQVTRGKPDAEGLLLARDQLHLDADQPIAVFEDSIPGLLAVRAAGMIPIAVEGTHPVEDLAALGATVVKQLGPELLTMPLSLSR